MGYGDTYAKRSSEQTKLQPKGDGETCARRPGKEECQRDSLVTSLCSDFGYGRENLDNIELEAKINLEVGKGSLSSQRKVSLDLGETLAYPEPYLLDKRLDASDAVHSCYAYVGRKLEAAFTKVSREDRTKIKVKGKAKYIERDGVVLIKRSEEHREDLDSGEVGKYIAERARESKIPLEYIGSFRKKSKEVFVFNPTSGRIFVMATNICTVELNPTPLYQLELEYYGQINGFSSGVTPADEIINIIQAMLKELPKKGISGTNSKLTKFEWLVKNVR